MVVDLAPHYDGGNGGDPPGGGRVDNSDLNTRLSRIEGGWAIYQWAVGVVSAVIIGGMAIMISFQISGQSDLKVQQATLEGKLETLSRTVDGIAAKLDQNITLSNQMYDAVKEIKHEVKPPMAELPR
jgi:hypothetical protein